jgi:hypothetical protein
MKEGWYTDPYGTHEARWYSNDEPTALVRDGTTEGHDTPPLAPPTGEAQAISTSAPSHGDDLKRIGPIDPDFGTTPYEQMEQRDYAQRRTLGRLWIHLVGGAVTIVIGLVLYFAGSGSKSGALFLMVIGAVWLIVSFWLLRRRGRLGGSSKKLPQSQPPTSSGEISHF